MQLNLSVPPASANHYMDTTPFWQAVRERRLVLQVCLDTGCLQHYPRPVSRQTGTRNLGWREVDGMGVVYTWTILRTRVDGFEGADGLVLANVELDAGIRILGRVLGDEAKKITIGSRVQLDWDRFADATPYPAFRLMTDTVAGHP